MYSGHSFVRWICWAVWSSDGKYFYVASNRNASPTSLAKTLVIPVPAGKSLPDFPAAGIDLNVDGGELPGMRIIEHSPLSPGPDPSTYVFTRADAQRNLFRIPLH